MEPTPIERERQRKAVEAARVNACRRAPQLQPDPYYAQRLKAAKPLVDARNRLYMPTNTGVVAEMLPKSTQGATHGKRSRKSEPRTATVILDGVHVAPGLIPRPASSPPARLSRVHGMREAGTAMRPRSRHEHGEYEHTTTPCRLLRDDVRGEASHAPRAQRAQRTHHTHHTHSGGAHNMFGNTTSNVGEGKLDDGPPQRRDQVRRQRSGKQLPLSCETSAAHPPSAVGHLKRHGSSSNLHGPRKRWRQLQSWVSHKRAQRFLWFDVVNAVMGLKAATGRQHHGGHRGRRIGFEQSQPPQQLGAEWRRMTRPGPTKPSELRQETIARFLHQPWPPAEEPSYDTDRPQSAEATPLRASRDGLTAFVLPRRIPPYAMLSRALPPLTVEQLGRRQQLAGTISCAGTLLHDSACLVSH